MLELLQDDDAYLRDNAARILTYLGETRALADSADPRAVPVLIDALGYGNLPTRRAVAEALHTLTGQNFGTESAQWRAWREEQGK